MVNGTVFNVLTWKFKNYEVWQLYANAQIVNYIVIFLVFEIQASGNILIQMRLMLGPNEETLVLKEFE